MAGLSSKKIQMKRRFPRKNGCHYCSIRFRAIIGESSMLKKINNTTHE
jgi:hypothetical protein